MDDRVWRICGMAMTGQKKNTRRETCSKCTSPSTNSKWFALGSDPLLPRWGAGQLPSWAAAWSKSLYDGLITKSCTIEQDGLMQIFSVNVFVKRTQVHITFLFWKIFLSWIYGAFFLLAKTHSGLKGSDTVSVKSGLPRAHRFNSRPRCPEKYSVELNL